MIDILIYLLVIAVLVGLVLYVADTLLPDPANRIIKIIAIVVACLAAVLLLLRLIGVDTGLDLPRVG